MLKIVSKPHRSALKAGSTTEQKVFARLFVPLGMGRRTQRLERCRFTRSGFAGAKRQSLLARREGREAGALDSSVEAQGKTNAKKPHRVLESLDAAFMYEVGDGGFEPPTPTMST